MTISRSPAAIGRSTSSFTRPRDRSDDARASIGPRRRKPVRGVEIDRLVRRIAGMTIAVSQVVVISCNTPASGRRGHGSDRSEPGQRVERPTAPTSRDAAVAPTDTGTARRTFAWEPPLDDVLDGENRFSSPARLMYCASPGSCVEAVSARASDRFRASDVSTNGRRAFVALERNERVLIGVYDAETGRAAVCDPGPGFSASASGEIAWSRGDNLLVTWGAGSYVSFVRLFDRRCRELLSTGEAGDDVSPDRGYLLVFHPAGAPQASEKELELYDLVSGRRVLSRHGRGARHVVDVHWSADAVTIQYADAEPRTSREVIPLMRPASGPAPTSTQSRP